MLTDKKIEKFQRIYFKEYGEKLPFDEAKELATRLVDFYKLIFKVRPKPTESKTKSVKYEIQKQNKK